MQLTKQGQQLFNEISPAINVISEAEKKFLFNKNINFGTFATMLSNVLSDCIAEFYKENKDSKITTITEQFDSLVSKLLNHELDILVSNKIDERIYDTSKIKYIKLGFADFVLITNNSSELCNKNIKINDLKNKIIYIPRGETESVLAFTKMISENNLENEIKKIDSVTMCNIIENHDCIGLINKAYIREKIEKNKVTILNTDFRIPSTEFGIYIQKNNTFPELKKFIKIVKNKFDHN